MRWLFVLLFLSILPADGLAQARPRAGLMWNHSGLPATFPLVVKTPHGEDYVMFVANPEDGAAVMAGYIRGGDFFRLLLPPGDWRLRFASGKEWQGENGLFGTATDWIELQQVLDFRVLGINRRRAYVVTLAEQNGTMKSVDARAGTECQRLLWDSTNREWPEDLPGLPRDDRALPSDLQTGPIARPPLRYVDRDFDIHTRLCS